MRDAADDDEEDAEGAEPLAPLERVDLLLGLIPAENPLHGELLALRAALAEREEVVGEAREAIEKLEGIVKKLSSPANRIGTFLGAPNPETAQVVVGGADYYCNVDPRVRLGRLRSGTRVLVNEAFVVVGDLGFDRQGPVTKITEVLGPDRLRVGSEHGTQSLVIQRGGDLLKEKLKAGDEVRVDGNFRVAVEVLANPQSQEHYLESVPELPWEKVGGQEEALREIREAIELPLLHADLFARYEHATPKGFLLYGPPGCGKTLIGKATAYNLTAQLKAKTGEDMREYFMHIKGPEILNMWVGESERIVREIFATAREKRREGCLPFLFIDEAESILGTRRSGRFSSILSTLVPMFCTEMDGIESLNQVVIILASNRADLIDPAILRPGRIDRRIKVRRPDRAGATEIYRIYLSEKLPYDPELIAEAGGVPAAIERLVAGVVEAQFAKRPENRLLEITLRSGRKETLDRGDLVSGALIASVVERAKGSAIKRALATEGDAGIREQDLLAALEAEYREHGIFPPSEMTEDWLKLIDHDPENVVKVTPIRAEPRAGRSGII